MGDDFNRDVPGGEVLEARASLTLARHLDASHVARPERAFVDTEFSAPPSGWRYDAIQDRFPQRFSADVKSWNANRTDQLPLELGDLRNSPRYGYTTFTKKWGLVGDENVIVYALILYEGYQGRHSLEELPLSYVRKADGFMLLVDLKGFRNLWWQDWSGVFPNVGMDITGEHLLAFEDATVLPAPRWDKLDALGGRREGVEELARHLWHPTKSWTWNAYYSEEELREGGLLLAPRIEPLLPIDWRKIDARLVLNPSWTGVLAFADYVRSLFPAPQEQLAKDARPVVYFDSLLDPASSLNKLSPKAQATRLFLSCLGEVSDLLYYSTAYNSSNLRGMLPYRLETVNDSLKAGFKVTPEILAELEAGGHVDRRSGYLTTHAHEAYQTFKNFDPGPD